MCLTKSPPRNLREDPMEVDIEEETEVNIQPVEEFEDLLVSPAPTN